jgi:hypothetical protein
MSKQYKVIIGIDPGVQTGFAMYSKVGKRLLQVETLSMLQAMQLVDQTKLLIGEGFLVRVEDARKRNWFGRAGREKLQGAGSIKRECQIWEDHLKEQNIDFELVAPKNNKTKLKDQPFRMITGWKKATSSHARDAAMLVYGF